MLCVYLKPYVLLWQKEAIQSHEVVLPHHLIEDRECIDVCIQLAFLHEPWAVVAI